VNTVINLWDETTDIFCVRTIMQESVKEGNKYTIINNNNIIKLLKIFHT
jgi:hypothetical protein